MPRYVDLDNPAPELILAEAWKVARTKMPELDEFSFKLGYLIAFEQGVEAAKADRDKWRAAIEALQA